MKKGWEYKKLGDVCTFINGFAFKSNKFTNEGSPIIRISDIQNGMVDDTNVVYFDINSYSENLSKYKVYPNDILIAMSGGTTGKIGINYTNKEFYLNQRVGVFRENTSVLNHMFLFYFLQTKGTESLVIAAGAAQPNLSTAQIKNFVIPLPPLSEQKEIVEYLDSSFAKIETLKANAAKNLDEAKALFQSALKEALEPKKGWEEKTINDVVLFRNGIAHEKDIDKGGNYIVINSKFVATEGTIRKYTNEQLSPLYTNEIVMVMSDVPKGKTLAKCYIIDCDNKYSLNQRICAFKSKGLDVKFLYYMLNRNPNLLKYDNGENQTNLRKNQILECPVTYPVQKNEQQEIVDKLDSLKSKVDRLQENFDKISMECDALKQAILRQVFE